MLWPSSVEFELVKIPVDTSKKTTSLVIFQTKFVATPVEEQQLLILIHFWLDVKAGA